jgi:anti-sigma factor RsiW
MRTSIGRSFLAAAALAAITAGCASGPQTTCPKAQAIVDSIAKEHPEVVRLTVHEVPPAGGECHAVASTSSDKRGKPSDPEDLEAMKTGVDGGPNPPVSGAGSRCVT